MQQLEQRVAALEELIGTEDFNSLETIHNALITLKSAVKTQPLQQKLQKLAQVIINYDTNYCYEVLSPENKMIILQNSEAQLIKSQKILRMIVQNKKYIDFEPIIDIQDKIGQILTLQTTSKILNDCNKEQTNQTQNPALLSDEFQKYSRQLESLVKLNYELKLAIK